jgi:ribosomal-protein-alanine N-acetyltransferase
MSPIIETERLLIRPFVPDDLDDFYRLVTDPDVTRFTGDKGGSREEVRKGMEERIFADYRVVGYGRWATVLKTTGRLIGFAGLKYLPDVGETDLGYRFFKEYWGQGLATEAARAVLDFGLRSFALTRVIGIADRDNKASIRVLEKLGFRFEKFTIYRGSDVAWYALERGKR